MKVILILLVFISNCNIIPSPERGLGVLWKLLITLGLAPLSVNSIQPKNGTTNIVLNSNIFIGFNQNIGTFDEKNFSITDASNVAHPGTLIVSENFLTFNQSINFKEFTKYTITISKNAGIASDFQSSFTTGNTIDNSPPNIVKTTPQESEKDYPLNASIIFVYNEIIDPTSVTTSVFSISGGIDADRSAEEQNAKLKPRINLPQQTAFIVTMRAGVKDLAGNKTTAPYSILFSTGSSTLNDNCTFDSGLWNFCLYR